MAPHIRTPKITEIPIHQLETSARADLDQQFLKLWSGYLQGKLLVGFSRVRLEHITPGHYTRQNESIKHRREKTDIFVDNVAQMIRSGSRPSLHIYWSNLCPKDIKWVCPDDQNTYAAYEKLGIKDVPCMLLKPQATPLQHANIIFRYAKKLNYTKAIAPLKRGRVAKLSNRDGYRKELENCSLKLVSIKTKITEFSRGLQQENSYHIMLLAVLDHQIACIKYFLLMEKDSQYDLCASVVRQAYEGMLNFYFDWLAPEIFGELLRLHANVKSFRKDSKEYKEANKILKEKIGNFSELIGTTAKKAEINPIGSELHDRIYTTLSQAAHQAYSNIERRSLFLKQPDKSTFSDLSNILNVICCEVGQLSQNEIGNYAEFQIER